jgi:hypothetical protein
MEVAGTSHDDDARLACQAFVARTINPAKQSRRYARNGCNDFLLIVHIDNYLFLGKPLD